MAVQSTKSFYGFEDRPQLSIAAPSARTPSLHSPLHMPCAAEQTLGRTRGHQRLPEALREAERQDRERLIESFTHAARSTGIAVFESPRQVAQHGVRDRDVGCW